MNARARKVLELSAGERDELVRKLIPTLDSEAFAEIEQAWAGVITTRARSARRDGADTRPRRSTHRA